MLDGRLIKLSWPCFQQSNIGKRFVLTVRVPNFDPTPSSTGIPDVLVIACYGPVSIDGLDIERGRGKSSSNTVWHSRCKEFWGIIGIRIVLREGIHSNDSARFDRTSSACDPFWHVLPTFQLGIPRRIKHCHYQKPDGLVVFFLALTVVSWVHSFWNLLVGLNQTCATWRNKEQ